ncbi:MAG: ethylbenzene dehydrogenase-related protein [Pseudomonadales bacterium]|nr:ethylbenzene dehydrogenase-related protein [Pseudomonadales bacterium]
METQKDFFMLKPTRSIMGSILIFFAASSLAQEAPLEWVSTYTSTSPTIDGGMDEVWESAVALTVVVRRAFGGTDPREVVLRALHTEDSLYVLAQWPDPTRSDLRDPYIWHAESERYERPTLADDQFALEFPLEGEFQVSMLPEGKSFSADVWHWKAGRSNLDGWVDDKRHIISTEPVDGALPYQLGGRAVIYIARPMDAGMASYKEVEPPESFRGDILPSYEIQAQAPSDSQLDIRGKGVHDGIGWTLEMTRRFNTGNTDDAVIDPRQEIFCAIAVLDNELYWQHSVSQKLVLRFHP